MRVPPGEREAFMKALYAGVEEFNKRRFFEAYEIWETRWKEETTEGADLLQGLMQIAFAYSKLASGELGAARKLLGTCQDLFEGYPDDAYELDLTAIRGAAEAMLAQISEGDGTT